jgi:hypothetical protein
MRRILCALTALLLMSGSASAKADECAKFRGFNVDLTPIEAGYVMPLGIAGTPRQFFLELGSALTKMDEAIAEELKFPMKPMPNGISVVDGAGPFTRIAVVPELMLGPVNRKDTEILIGSHRSDWGASASGVAGMDVFHGLDLELDLAHNRLGLYLPREGCKFAPFWPAVEWGTGDLKIVPTGGFILPMYLDDRKLFVTINTREARTFMSFESARTLFGIKEGDPRLVQAEFRVPGEVVYRFPFRSLSGGNNVTINAPEIYIIGNTQTCGGIRQQVRWTNTKVYKCFGGGDLQLGNNLLKELHFFFAIKDKKVYFTLAEPPAQK